MFLKIPARTSGLVLAPDALAAGPRAASLSRAAPAHVSAEGQRVAAETSGLVLARYALAAGPRAASLARAAPANVPAEGQRVAADGALQS